MISAVFLSVVVNAAVVATSSPYATEAARATLRKGGNAYDAACAAVFALGVSQPYFTGIGGGGFSVTARKGESPRFYDFREQALAQTTDRLFYKDGKPVEDPSIHNGAWSVGVPGVVAGCGRLTQSGKLPWHEVVAPAIALAHDGITISQLFFEELTEQWGRFDGALPGMRSTLSIFGGTSGSGLKKDDKLVQPLVEGTLKTLATEGPKAFYQGPLADAWRAEAQSIGIPLRSDDLASYRVKEAAPVKFMFGARMGFTAALPSRAGHKVGGVLALLHGLDGSLGPGQPISTERYIAQIEALAYVSERGQAPVDSNSIKAVQKNISDRLTRAKTKNSPTTQQAPSAAPRTHTAHVSVVDDEGNVVALTSSVGDIFGSGLTLPKHGFVLNSTMTDFDVKAGLPNSPGPKKRPLSNMSPTLIYEGGKPSASTLIAAVGAAGGPLIPQAVVQFLRNYFDHGLPAAQAIKVPRVSLDGPNKISIEKSVPSEIIGDLKRAGYQVTETDTIWAVFEGAVRRTPNSDWEGVTESRYDGEAWVGSGK